MDTNPVGEMLQKWYFELQNKFQNIYCDKFICMPNHVHFIVINHASGDSNSGAHTGAPLHKIVQWYKTMTTNDYIRRVKEGVFPPLENKLWQRNYYEHILRENEYDTVCEYIQTNPLRWELDKLNPNFES